MDELRRRFALERASDAAVAVGVWALSVLALLGAGPAGRPAGSTTPGGSWVLQVKDAAGWRTWWRADSAPDAWPHPVQAVLDATVWQSVAQWVDLGEVVISGGSLALRTRIVLGRFDLEHNRMLLAGQGSRLARRAGWSIDSAASRAVLAFNAGQFSDSGAWGWLVRAGREHQAPGWGPLSMAVAVGWDGGARFVSAAGLEALRDREDVQEAFQSYPALLVEDGRVPERLRNPGRVVDLGHRDTRLALCVLRNGRLLVALTRFDNLGRVFGGLPIGLTLGETAAVMGALGCRRAVGLDGGLSAQLLVRPDAGPVRRWHGSRTVPLGIEIVPRP